MKKRLEHIFDIMLPIYPFRSRIGSPRPWGALGRWVGVGGKAGRQCAGREGRRGFWGGVLVEDPGKKHYFFPQK